VISKIQDGGSSHSENLKNCITSVMERPIVTKFGTVMRLDCPNTAGQENFVNSKIEDGSCRHHKKYRKIIISSQLIGQFLQNYAC